MKTIRHFFFLIHGFCYTEMTRGSQDVAPNLLPYLQREQACAEKWQARLADFSPTDALVVIPTQPACGPALNYYLVNARSRLGDRLFLLDCPDAMSPDFWLQSHEFGRDILNELQAAFVQQQLRCNNEELVTHLHCLACARQFERLLEERGYTFDVATTIGKAWGASFEGCVTKYSASLRYLLDLHQPIAIDFHLTVPDAQFLLDVSQFDWIELTDQLRLNFFDTARGPAALYTSTSHSLANAPRFVSLTHDLAHATILSKQGTRLWPDSELYELPGAPPEYHEPAQQVVTIENDCLRVPVSSGFVYRLAKAPAYIFAPEGMGRGEFRWLLIDGLQQRAAYTDIAESTGEKNNLRFNSMPTTDSPQ